MIHVKDIRIKVYVTVYRSDGQNLTKEQAINTAVLADKGNGTFEVAEAYRISQREMGVIFVQDR